MPEQMENKMKNSFISTCAGGLVALQLLSLGAHADQFKKILTCDGGAVIDLNTTYKQDAQLVIRDQAVLRYFHEKGLVSLNWNQSEVVIQGRSGYLDSSRQLPVLTHQEMESERDFVSIISIKQPVSEGDGMQAELFNIRKNGSSVILQKYYLTNRLITPDPENAQTWYKETRLDLLGEYTFNNCRPN
jgi:hypothetical protein